jgi:plasmid maintenance system antidote protein VapI
MVKYVAKRDRNRCPTHPGELLREVIPVTGKTRSEIAALLGISRQHLYDILNERKHMILGMRNANCPTRSGGYPQ